MAPNISRHNYPITTGLCQLSPSSGHAKDDFPQLNSSTSLAHLGEKPMDDYLKQVMHHLKGAFEMYAKSTICIKIQQLKKLPHPTTLQALGILNQSLLQSHILLKNVIQLGSEDGINEDEIGIKEGEIAKLKKLEKHLLTLTGFLDGILMYYSNSCVGCKAPHVEEIKRTAKKLYKVINSMKPEKLHGLCPNILVAEEGILCSVLGLQGDVACKLKELSPELQNHQTDMYFLLGFLEERAEYSESLTDTDMASKLHEMGFTENRSDVIAKWIAEQSFPEHQSLLAWAQHYIESLFKYDIFLNDYVCRYPYKEKVLDEWFTISVERDKEADDGVVKINVINTTRGTPEDTSRSIDEKLIEIQQEKQGKLYYHGTGHKGAKSILEDGINLGAGKRGCNFSDGYGFYLTESRDCAKQWSEKSDAGALLVFNISEDHLSGYKSLDLNPSDRKSDWKHVIECCGSKNKLRGKLGRDCENCDFIIGPMSRDGSTKNPGVVYEQICIKKKAMADSIGNPANICAVIFKNK